MSRIPEIPESAMTPDQRQVAAAISGGPRGGVSGPFKVLLHSPKLADLVQALGAYVRFDCKVPPKEREIAILVTAHHWRAQYEWYAHARLALQAGVPDAIIEAIRTGARPSFENRSQEAVYDFACELYATRRVSDRTFGRVKDLLGTEGVIDLAGLLGHYNVIAITLNVCAVETPDGSKPLAE